MDLIDFNLIELNQFFLIFAICIFGIIAGSIPGISPPMVVSLVVPFTFILGVQNSFLAMGSLYFSTIFGGSITAIFLGIPGTPSAIAATFDGHKMYRNGFGREAVIYSFYASFFGSIVGLTAFVYLFKNLGNLFLNFGAKEIFWMILFSFIICINFKKNLFLMSFFSLFLGVIFSFVGYSDLTGKSRFAFVDELNSGFNLISVICAVYAVPEIIKMKNTKKKIINIKDKREIKLLSLFFNFLKFKSSLFFSSIIGMIVGIMPGLGGAVAGLFSYNFLKQNTKNRKIGYGHPEGVIAPEVSASAMIGPSMIPLFFLGIPGSATCAAILGGMLMHGIYPSHNILNLNRDLFTFFITVLLTSIFFLLIVGTIFYRLWSSIFDINTNVLKTILIVLIIFGVYFYENNMMHVVVTILLGYIIYIFEQFKFDKTLFIIGFMLTPHLEFNFLQGILLLEAKNDKMFFFSGYICISIIFLIILVLLIKSPIFKNVKIFK